MAKKFLVTIGALALVGSLALPSTASAQWVVRGGFGWGWGYPGWYGPWGAWGYGWGPYWGGPWGYPYGGYGYYGYYGNWSSIRIEAQPKTAEVYVDGSLAGIVDNYDSWYQGLNLHVGQHEITLYLEGYRTVKRQMYFAPASSQHVKLILEKLGAGETSGPRPQPAPPPPPPSRDDQMRPGQPPYRQVPEPPPDAQVRVQQQSPPQDASVRFGTLSLRIQPGDAEVYVDGQPWTIAPGDTRLSIRLSAGKHHLWVHKNGFDGYEEDILIRPEATMALNVGLTKK